LNFDAGIEGRDRDSKDQSSTGKDYSFRYSSNHSVFFDDLLVKLDANFWDAFLRLEVDVSDAEAFAAPVGPLEVVEEAPAQVAMGVAKGEGSPDRDVVR
jgi:hypothetical protein